MKTNYFASKNKADLNKKNTLKNEIKNNDNIDKINKFFISKEYQNLFRLLRKV